MNPIAKTQIRILATVALLSMSDAAEASTNAFKWVRGQVFVSTQDAPFPSTIGINAGFVFAERLRVRAGGSMLGFNVRDSFGSEADLYFLKNAVSSTATVRLFVGGGYREYDYQEFEILWNDNPTYFHRHVLGTAGIEYREKSLLVGAQLNFVARQLTDNSSKSRYEEYEDGEYPMMVGVYVGGEF